MQKARAAAAAVSIRNCARLRPVNFGYACKLGLEGRVSKRAHRFFTLEFNHVRSFAVLGRKPPYARGFSPKRAIRRFEVGHGGKAR